MVRTQIQLTKEQAEYLRRLAALRGVSLAALIREAVDRLAGSEQRNELLERAREAIGSASSDRSDVAEHHDRYLAEIYGEQE